MKMRLTGSAGSPPNPTPVNGQSSSDWPGRPTVRSGLGAGALTPAALSRNVPGPPRSEEHTSELQSQSNLVCRLLLEKKKKKKNKKLEVSTHTNDKIMLGVSLRNE